jgi:hypothetical protein
MEENRMIWYSANDFQFDRKVLPADGGGFGDILIATHAQHGKVALKRLGVSNL